VVVGCGAVGLAAIQAARLAGAGEIVAVDIEPAKREAARRCGATVTVDPAEADPGDLARRRTEGRGADVAFEAVGSADAIRQAVRATRRGGVTVAMGLARPSELLDLPAAELVTGRKTLIGSIYGGSDPRRLVPTIVDLAQREKLDLAPLVSHRIAIGDVPAALTVDGDGAVVRTVVTFGGS
jgi:S-(hydroxymethyl)glutathione dehydrogenase/alcohol dehydrogenase